MDWQPTLEQAVAFLVVGRQAGERLLDLLAGELRRAGAGRAADEPLEAGVGGEDAQVAEFEPGAEHPEAGIDGIAEQAERRQADPVRRRRTCRSAAR